MFRRMLPLTGAALALMLATSPADAACCYFSAKNADILQPAQKAFLTWDPVEKVETFTVQPKFEGNALDFGMVIPTPSQPKLHEMPRDFFKHLAYFRLSGVGIALHVPSKLASSCGEPARSHKVIVGPLLLGELFDTMPDQTNLDKPYKHVRDDLAAHGLKHQDVVRALNKCKVYIVDHSDMDDERLVGSGENIMLVTAGNMAVDVADKRGESALVCLVSIQLETPIITAKRGLSRRTNAKIELRVVRPEAKAAPRMRTYVFGSENFKWTAQGVRITVSEE
jgi:hypothetical protein